MRGGGEQDREGEWHLDRYSQSSVGGTLKLSTKLAHSFVCDCFLEAQLRSTASQYHYNVPMRYMCL